MGFIDKILDTAFGKLDDQSEPQITSTNYNSNWDRKISAEIYKKHGRKLDHLTQKMMKFYENNSYEELRDCCLEMCLIDVNHIDARRMLVYAEKELEMYQSACDRCSELLLEMPGDIFLIQEMGLILFRLGRYFDSIPHFEQLISRIPYTDPEALVCKHKKAFALYYSREFEKAVEFCTSQLDLHPNDKVLLEIRNDSTYKIQDQENQVLPLDNSGFSIADELEKLANLKAQGTITENEFSQMKQKLLEKM